MRPSNQAEARQGIILGINTRYLQKPYHDTVFKPKKLPNDLTNPKFY